MKVCIIVEGAYPYVNGGVSSWLQQLLLDMPEVEFVIQVITAGKEGPKEFKYKIPGNVTEIQEIYLMDDDVVSGEASKKLRLTETEYEAFESLMFGENIDWQVLFRFFSENRISLNALFGGGDFLKMTTRYYHTHFERAVFSDFLWTMRSMYLPLFTVMKAPLLEADLYHPVSTGYAGILAGMEKSVFHKKMMLTEHGIYTREREEELIRADWVRNIYKELWIDQFRKLSQCCYEQADIVTSLFRDANEYQVELGCSREKTRVIPNGVNLEAFAGLEQKEEGDKSFHVGAVVRVAPIKDIKTMISAFGIAKRENSRLKLWIMGPVEESGRYARECMQLAEELEITDVVFTGTVNVKDYLGKMDVLILSSISEGQPLAVLEAFAAHKPVIATNVGNCRGLIYGDLDDFGRAGYVVPVMNTEKIAGAIIELAKNEALRQEMGENGYRRVCAHYRSEESYGKYREAYDELYRSLKSGSGWEADEQIEGLHKEETDEWSDAKSRTETQDWTEAWNKTEDSEGPEDWNEIEDSEVLENWNNRKVSESIEDWNKIKENEKLENWKNRKVSADKESRNQPEEIQKKEFWDKPEVNKNKEVWNRKEEIENSHNWDDLKEPFGIKEREAWLELE